MERFTFVRTAGSNAEIPLTGADLAPAGLSLPGELLLSHGARRVRAPVGPAPGGGQPIAIAGALADELGLVEAVPYRLALAGGELRIGPVIGILAAGKTSSIITEPGSRAYEWLLRYGDVGGLVYLFALDGVDMTTETITGYAWRPDRASPLPECVGRHWEGPGYQAERSMARARAEAGSLPPNRLAAKYREVREQFLREAATPHGALRAEPAPAAGSFVKGRFPFPSALWLRWEAPGDEVYERLWSRVGPGTFNARPDRQADNRWMHTLPEIRPYLPETVPFTRFADMFYRLDRHGRIALNRQGVELPHGLAQVERDGDGFFLRFGRGDRGEYFRTRTEVEARLEPLVSAGAYLVQQAVELPHYRGRPVDFRVTMQKDGRGRWTVRGMLGRFGKRGAKGTHLATHGYGLPVDEALRRAFDANWRGVHRLKERMMGLAYMVSRAVDQTGQHYGDIELDIGMDRHGCPWLLGVSRLPDHDLPLYMGDGQMYLDMVSGPLLFASHLAGFSQD